MPYPHDESLRRALRDIDKFQDLPAQREMMRHFDRMQRDPSYQAIMSEVDRRRRDPSYRALMENIDKINSDPAYRALLQFENDRNKYLNISGLPPAAFIDQNIPKYARDLQRDLLKNNTEFWIKKEILESESKFRNYEKAVARTSDIKPVSSFKIRSAEPPEDAPEPVSAAAQKIKRINEDYVSAANELHGDERLVMFAVLGGKEYRIKSLIAEENTDRIKVFIDSRQGGMFVYSDPSTITVMYGKEKVPFGKKKSRVNFLSYKRGAGKKEEFSIFSNRTKKVKMAQVSIIRIVVASPGDVMEERHALEDIVLDINQGIGRKFGLRLELTKWETDAYPGFHPEGPQGMIDPILNIEESDIFIGIFWKRFGTPVLDANSGTEHEFLKAYQAWQAKGTPHIMFYFKEKPYFHKSKEETEQMGKVIDFKKNFPVEGLWWAYESESEFERLLRNQLTNLVLNYHQTEDEADDEETDDFSGEENKEDQEPETLHNERIVLSAGGSETYDFTLASGNKLIVDVKSNEPITIAIIDTDDSEDWENNEEVDTHDCFENRKRIAFRFEPEEDGEYSIVLSNNAVLTEAEVDIEISYLD